MALAAVGVQWIAFATGTTFGKSFQALHALQQIMDDRDARPVDTEIFVQP